MPNNKLVEIDVVRQSYAGGIYNLLPYDGYRWYFLEKQTPDELLLMKMYDSSTDVDAKCERLQLMQLEEPVLTDV